MKSIEFFNYTNTVAVTINYNLKKKMNEVLKNMKYDKITISINLQKYDDISYRIVSTLQQGIFNNLSVTDISSQIYDILNNTNIILLYPHEIEDIINKYIKKNEKE